MTTKKITVGLVIMMFISMAISSSLAQVMTCTDAVKQFNIDCKGEKTVADMASCCTDYNSIASSDPECFCGILYKILRFNPAADVKSIFPLCAIPGSFTSLCPN
ncbi:hypothetical protein RND81_13G167200 [Saponaria officinalis]|uniref:Bifunctional inhibitor/plant lipid transfer protein/seed storage helical domain-containing protein n=1 Tax=Saponaria officinalis TaxID=3572 RepID=A0AAW1H447_SAPOF